MGIKIVIKRSPITIYPSFPGLVFALLASHIFRTEWPAVPLHQPPTLEDQVIFLLKFSSSAFENPVP